MKMLLELIRGSFSIRRWALPFSWRIVTDQVKSAVRHLEIVVSD